MDLALRQLMTNDTPHINEVIGNNIINKDDVGVYVLSNPVTGETYVGSGLLASRYYRHSKELSNGKHHNHKLQKAFDKNSIFEFNYVITETREEAYDIEQKMLDKFITDDCLLNIASDARAAATSRVISEETRNKLRLAGMGRVVSKETRDKLSKANSGTILSDEHKAKLSQAHKESIKAKEHIEKLHTTQFGKKHTPEHCMNISKGNVGKVVSDETKAKMSLALKGRIVTEEDKLVYKQSIKCQENLEKMRLGNIGRGKSPETVAKMLKTRNENKSLKLNSLIKEI